MSRKNICRSRFHHRTLRGGTHLSAESLEPRNLLAVFTVTSSFDGTSGDLRSAVAAADVSPGMDTIQFNVNMVQLTLGEIQIRDTVDINGASAPGGHVSVTAAPGSRIFNVDDGGQPVPQFVVMNELTLSGGDSPEGGAITNREDLLIQNSTITGNTARIGGGIANRFGRVVLDQSTVYDNYAEYEGGGIHNNEGVLEARFSTVMANRVMNNNGGFTFGGGIQNIGRALAMLDHSQVLGNGAYASSGARAHGGGISTMLESVVHLVDSDVGDNFASHDGGGMFVVDNSNMIVEQSSSIFGNIAGEAGGGVYLRNGVVADVMVSTISDNATELRGGGLSAGNDVTLNVVNSDILRNTTELFSADGSGGGFYFSGFGQASGPQVTITGSRIIGNNRGPSLTPGGEFGGGISVRYGSNVTIDATVIQQNMASVSGGGIYSSDKFTPFAPTLTIVGSQILENEAGLQGGGIAIAGGTLDLTANNIDNNVAQSRGGGLFLTGLGSPNPLNVSVRSSVISGNAADLEGGGVAAGPNLTLTVDDSQVSQNRTLGRGGGLYLTSLGLGVAPHHTTISNSMISNNRAIYDPTIPSYASAGGVWAGPAANVSVSASTIRGNRAGRYGGGMMSNEAAYFDLADSTINANSAGVSGGGAYIKNGDALLLQNTWTDNSAANDGGAIHLYSFLQNHLTVAENTISLNGADSDVNGSGTGGGISVDNSPTNNVHLDLKNSIVADNFTGLPASLPHNDDLFDGPGLAGNPPVAAHFSLIGSRKGTTLVAANPDANGNIVGNALLPINAQLGSLANNGGTTDTMLPQAGSPAIDSADPSVGPGGVDQRGTPFVRVFNGRMDMGAVEVQTTLPGPDLNFDGFANIVDLDLLTQAIVATTYVAGYDLNGDGVLSLGDVDRWLCKAGHINLGTNLSYRYADANLDGNVDGVDFIIWNANKFSASSLWSRGDFNADGFVDGVDFIFWNSNKFQAPFNCNPLPIVAGGGHQETKTTALAVVPAPLDVAAANSSSQLTESIAISPWKRQIKLAASNGTQKRETDRVVELVFATFERSGIE